MRPVIVLANWMDKNGVLNDESSSRVDRAIALLETEYSHLLLMGWHCVKECEISIAEAMYEYCRSNGVSTQKLLLDKRSRDTVGDAIYSRKFLSQIKNVKAIAVVSSDYHIKRTKIIFDRVYGYPNLLRFFSANTDLDRAKEENKSLLDFDNTFQGVQSGNLAQFESVMVKFHPFYNGTIHPKVVTE